MMQKKPVWLFNWDELKTKTDLMRLSTADIIINKINDLKLNKKSKSSW